MWAGFDAFHLCLERRRDSRKLYQLHETPCNIPLAILRSYSEKIKLCYRIVPAPPSQFHPSAF